MIISPTKLSHIRKSNGISQEELASKLEIKKPNISNWERGTKAVPVKYHQKICDILGVSIDELCEKIYNAPVVQGKKQIPPYRVSSIPVVGTAQALRFDRTLESFDDFLSHGSNAVGKAPVISSMGSEGMAALWVDKSIANTTYPAGTILYFNYLQNPQDGSRVIAKLRDRQKLTFRLFSKNKKTGLIELASFNNINEEPIRFSSPADNPFEWIFPIRYSLRDETMMERFFDPKHNGGWIIN